MCSGQMQSCVCGCRRCTLLVLLLPTLLPLLLLLLLCLLLPLLLYDCRRLVPF